MGAASDRDPVAPESLAALRRVGSRRGGRVPYIQQLEAADCGAACLAMLLAYHGHTATLDACRVATGTNRGTDALGILRGAEQFGLRGRGLRIDIDDLVHLPAGSILHWDFTHFVVFERFRRGQVELVDPSYGRRRIPVDRFRRHFTGIALVCEPSEEFVVSPPGRSKVWGYLGKLLSHRGLVARVIVTSVMLRLFALAVPILTAMVVDRMVPRGDHDLLTVVGAGMAALLLFLFVSALIRAHLLIQLRTAMDVRMTLGFVSHLLSLPYAFFTRRSTGDLLLRVQSNSQIRDLLTSSVLSSLLDGVLAATYLTLLAVLSPTMALVTVGAAAIQVMVLLLTRRRYRELASQDLETRSRAYSYLAQMMAGIETLKVTGAEHRSLENFSNLYVDEINVSLQRSRLTAVIDSLNALVQAGAPLVLLAVGASLVLDGRMSLGTMLATSALAGGFLIPLGALVTSALQLAVMGSHINRIDEVLGTEPEQRRQGAIRPPRLTGEIELRGVSFRYGGDEPLVVRAVDLTIQPGATLAIVGRSGSGKSTLAALLLGLHRPTEGRIFYDGYDLAELDHRILRQQLGMVPQHPFLFAGSIRQNIALADTSAPTERVMAAARRAAVHDDIMAMPMSYETIVSDGGSNLSGGQRQRIALARALLHDPAVVVLDEATSSLDATTEKQVMDQLLAVRATRIIIAHRLSTIIRADLIVVMEQGRIVETGSHDQLSRRDGVYAALVADQRFVGREVAS